MLIVNSTKKERQKHCGNNVFFRTDILALGVTSEHEALWNRARPGKKALRNPNASHFERTCGSDGIMKSDFYTDIFKWAVPLRHSSVALSGSIPETPRVLLSDRFTVSSVTGPVISSIGVGAEGVGGTPALLCTVGTRQNTRRRSIDVDTSFSCFFSSSPMV